MKWPLMIASPLAFVALASSLSAQPAALEEGVRLFREGRFDQALVKLEEAHRIAPRDATVENLLGITETQLGHIEAADNHYRNAIRLDPSQAAPHRNLGFNLFNSKDFVHAEPELREASHLNPNDNFAHYYLLLLALATNHDAEALAEASRAGQLVDNDPESDAELIESEVSLGRVDEATSRIARLEKANKLPSAREYRIAILLSQHALYGEAVHCFRQIASLNPSWENRYNLALALLYDGQPAEASALLTALRTERPANADTLMFLGSAFEMQQKMPEALEAYRAALMADPSNPDRTLDYTRLLMDMDRYDEAIQVVQTGLGESSSTVPLQLRLGAVEMVKGNYTAARDAFHSALAADPQLDVAYVGLAQTYARQANDVEAIHILESAREKLPGHYLLEYYFGLLASRLGREQDAIVALEKAAQLNPKSPDPFYELGKLYSSHQDWPQARQALEHVIELNPQFVPAHYQLSRVYEHLGLHSKAEQEAQQTRKLVDVQRDEAFRKQRERGASFQPQTPATSSPMP
ncbi:MAG: tetratricopeptide repeat protein [Terracidiphilus sp.]